MTVFMRNYPFAIVLFLMFLVVLFAALIVENFVLLILAAALGFAITFLYPEK